MGIAKFLKSLINKPRTALALVPLLLLLLTSFNIPNPAHRLIGIWESPEKNLRMEMFEDNGHFSGRMIWFQCSTDAIMENMVDKKNPDRSLADRKLLGLKLVEKLTYEGDQLWGSGKIYDPNTGKTWEACIRLTDSNTASVRGYWKFKIFGRNLLFNRLKK